MAIVTRPYSETSGTLAIASSVNQVIDLLYAEINGLLNSANIADSGVDSSNLKDSAVTTAKVADSAITESKLDGAVIGNIILQGKMFTY